MSIFDLFVARVSKSDFGASLPAWLYCNCENFLFSGLKMRSGVSSSPLRLRGHVITYPAEQFPADFEAFCSTLIQIF